MKISETIVSPCKSKGESFNKIMLTSDRLADIGCNVNVLPSQTKRNELQLL